MSRVSKVKENQYQPSEENFDELRVLSTLFMEDYKNDIVSSPLCEFLPQKFSTFMRFLGLKLIFLLFLVLR